MSDSKEIEHIVQDLRALAVSIGRLIPDPANARMHPEKNLDALKGSLALYKQRKPVVAMRANGRVIAGNGTLAAAKDLGWTHLAVVWVDDDPMTATGYAIADNRTAELAVWDKGALDRLLEQIPDVQDARVEQLLAELAQEQGLGPADDVQPTDVWPEMQATTTHTVTLRYGDEDEEILKIFVRQDKSGPLDPLMGGRRILERIKEIVAAGADPEQAGEATS